MEGKVKQLTSELIEHLPYTIFSVAAGMIILAILTVGSEIMGAIEISAPFRKLFHIFHPLHILFSATATTAMFWRHERKIFKAVLIGFVGAVGVCGISDIFIPYVAGFLLGVKMHLHICIIEHPGFIMPFALLGIFAGLMISPTTHKSTIFSHASHVLISSMASILYLIGFGLSNWINIAGMVLIYMVLAVMIPCCTSDIIFPLLLTKKE